jgi:hypothetical protein
MGDYAIRLRKSHFFSKHNQQTVERETGIEPASLAWKARVLPLNYSRANFVAEALGHHSPSDLFCLVEEAGFEPA